MLSIIRYYNKNVFIIFIILCREPFFAGGEAPALYSFNKYFNKKMKKYRTLRDLYSVYLQYILYTLHCIPPATTL